MKANAEMVRWLTRCSSSDLNFTYQLDRATAADCRKALEDQTLGKTARRRIEQRLRKLERSAK